MILMNDFKLEPPELHKSMKAAAGRVIDSGWYVLGQELKTLEEKWAETCGLAHGIGVGNGMDAIEISLRALDIGPGDEVITTPMTAFATVLAIIRSGATPVLADIDVDTALLSLQSARQCMTSRTKAVLLVHLYGQIKNMESWAGFCEQEGIALVEDCAQAHLAFCNGQAAGSFGPVGAYSFYPTKNFGALGDGGMVVTKSDVIEARARQLRNYGQSQRYHHPLAGLNSRLDEIQAAFLLERLKWLARFTQRRQQIAAKYHAGMNNSTIRLLSQPDDPAAHVYHLFVLLCAKRDALQEHLQDQGVQSLIHYPIPVHHQQPCREIIRARTGLGNSERHASTCLSLPCHPQMSNKDVAKVIAAVNNFRGD